MFGTKKHRGLIWSVIISSCFILISCEEKLLPQVEIVGETQGTTYRILIIEEDPEVTKAQIDSVLHEFDLVLSTYVKESIISKLNAGSESIVEEDPTGLFWRCYQESQRIYSLSGGLFDPSVMPLVKGWGFMNDMETPLSEKEVDSLLRFVSFEQGKLHELTKEKSTLTLKKRIPEFQLDFNAIAQGLSVDVLYEYLSGKGIDNFYVEIGGEVRVKGKNKTSGNWVLAIDSPKENLPQREMDTILYVTDKAIATSGNYRKFYVKDGVKYSHTLNPKTGYPVKHSLLSATVITDNCAKADGYATAFMVMGTEETLKFIEAHPEENLDVYLLYADEEGNIQHKFSKGFSKYLDESYQQ